MTNQEIITEVENIKDDVLNNRLTFAEGIDCLKTLSEATKREFSSLYNAFYSSKPELYIN